METPAAATSSAPPLPARNLCNEGDWALMLPSDGERRLMRVRRGTKFSSGRQQVLMDPLVGAPFGANFRIEASGLVRDPRTVEEIMGSLNDAICAQPDATNAALVDDCTAQTMSEADIRRLKQKGTDGAAVVKAIAAASATFASKTAFSQDKYLRKKAKKHMPFLTLAKPTPLSVCDMYMSKGPDRLLHLRRDSLALVLALSNAQPGSRVLVVESTLGLLTGALAQLIGGEGRVLSASLGKPMLDGVQWLNLPSEYLHATQACTLAELLGRPPPPEPPPLMPNVMSDAIAHGGPPTVRGDAPAAPAAAVAGLSTARSPSVSVCITRDARGSVAVSLTRGALAAPLAPLEEIELAISRLGREAPVKEVEMAEAAEGAKAAKTAKVAEAVKAAEAAEAAEAAAVDPAMDVDEAADKAAGADEVDANGEAASGEAGGEAGGEASAVRGGEHNPRKILTLRDAALSEVAAQGFTSLVVAVREAPAVAILALLARLVPGSPFVVYHPSITPLAECLHVCQQSRAAVRLQLMETWARKYQVADLRTHPEMNAYPATGYVLSGVAVLR